MNWDDDGFQLYQRAYRPVHDTIFGRGHRFRDPDEQMEVEHRVAVYAQQVETQGHIRKWLPRRGNGVSALAADLVRAEQ
jgi:hypothetical protein